MAYENDRDRHARLVKEFWSVKEKACQRCGVVQPNAFTHFGKKWFLDRQTFVTVNVCLSCGSKKLRDLWTKRRWKDYDYQVYKAVEAVRAARRERRVNPDAPREQWSEIDERIYAVMAPGKEPDAPRPTDE